MRFNRKIPRSKYGWLLLLLLLVVVNYLASLLHARIDLTKEKRYTLSRATVSLVKKLDDVVYIDVFLKGKFPSGFRKLANTTQEFLGLLKERNSSRIQYRFISPFDKMPDGQTVYADWLSSLGVTNINLTVQKTGEGSSNIIYPVAHIRYKNKQDIVTLFTGTSREIGQPEINSAEALMEYQFVKAIEKLVEARKPGVAYSVGNGEPVDHRTYDLQRSLEKDYDLKILPLQSATKIPDSVDVLMIVKPTQTFTEDEKLKIDQFVMRGGKLLCFIDNLIAEQDSLAIKPETIAYDRDLNLTDLFFRYGLRINTDLLMDLQCDVIPFVVGGTQENPQLEFLHWNYYPFLVPSSKITQNPGYVSGHFVNSIDTIQVPDVRKEALLVSSPNSRVISTPALISLNENRDAPQDEKFRRNAIPVAMLLEGKFTSLFRNRATKTQIDSLQNSGAGFLSESVPNKIIVVGDGDIVLNDFLPPRDTFPPEPLPMGWNKFTYSEYIRQTANANLFMAAANRQFLFNCLEYLTANPGISAIRNKDIVLRLLDSKKIRAQKTKWLLINIAAPVLLIILCGWFYQEFRRRKYSRE